MPNFKHSGAIGDLVYSLPAVKALGGGRLYLNTKGRHHWHNFLGGPVAQLQGFLEAQDYVESVEEWVGQKIDFDLDEFRKYFLPNRYQPRTTTLAAMQLETFGLPTSLQDEAWLSLPALAIQPVVINRSFRYRSPFFDWKKVLAEFGSGIVFVGLPAEHKAFCEEFGGVEHYPTKDLLELGRVIAGCQVFVGNQSAAFSIAEGLKKRAILECDLAAPNCIFGRPEALAKMVL